MCFFFAPITFFIIKGDDGVHNDALLGCWVSIHHHGHDKQTQVSSFLFLQTPKSENYFPPASSENTKPNPKRMFRWIKPGSLKHR